MFTREWRTRRRKWRDGGPLFEKNEMHQSHRRIGLAGPRKYEGTFAMVETQIDLFQSLRRGHASQKSSLLSLLQPWKTGRIHDMKTSRQSRVLLRELIKRRDARHPLLSLVHRRRRRRRRSKRAIRFYVKDNIVTESQSQTTTRRTIEHQQQITWHKKLGRRKFLFELKGNAFRLETGHHGSVM